MSDNKKKPRKEAMSRTVYFYILALVGVAVAGGCYYYAYYGCDLENEHSEMTCEYIFKLRMLPRMSNARVYLIGLLASWGVLDFKQSVRSFFDSSLVNTTEMFISPNISDLPIICEEMVVRGVKVYSYTPVEIVGINGLPLLIYLHGGGGYKSNPRFYDATFRFLSNKMKMRIIAPNYSKCPEAVFPKAHEECLNVVKYVFENSDKLGVDSQRISIGGDSYGGHLSLYVAFKWRELGYDKEHAPIYTMSLIYPWVQMASLELESYLKKENQLRLLSPYGVSMGLSMLLKGDIELTDLIFSSRLPLLSRHYEERKSSYPHLLPEIDWDPPASMVEQYSQFADTSLDPYSTFLFQKDFSHLPPTLIIASEYDLLLTEGQLLKQRMEETGTRIQYILYEKMFHGFFFLIPSFKLTTTFDAFDKLDDFLHSYTTQ